METRGPRDRAVGTSRPALAAALLLLLLLVGRTSCLSNSGPRQSAEVDHPPMEGTEGGSALPSPHALVFPEPPWTSRVGHYREDLVSPEYVPMEGQLCPEGHRLVDGECKLVLV